MTHMQKNVDSSVKEIAIARWRKQYYVRPDENKMVPPKKDYMFWL